MKKQQLVAIVIFIAVVAWMLIPREGISTAGEAKPVVVVTVAPEGIAALGGCSNYNSGLCFAGSTDAFARNKHPCDNSDKNYDCY